MSQLTTPLILAPPAAAQALYASIPAAIPLPATANRPPGFYAFPCLNPPTIALEFGGWSFPAFRGGGGAGGTAAPYRTREDVWREGRPGGRLSLGCRVLDGTSPAPRPPGCRPRAGARPAPSSPGQSRT